MSYVENNLLVGETIAYRARIHWFIFVPGALFLTFGIFMATVDSDMATAISIVAFVLAPISLIKAWVQKVTTELVVTSRRVIAKVGLIRRSTIELNHAKVESFNVEQTILGRLFGFGTLTVNGTGGNRTPIPDIDSPLQFRREAMQAIDTSQTSSQ